MVSTLYWNAHANHKRPKDPGKAARTRYKQRRYDAALVLERLRAAANEVLALGPTASVRDELDALLREIKRFVATTALTAEQQEPTPERREAFRKIHEATEALRKKS